MASQCVADNLVHNVRDNSLGTWLGAAQAAVTAWDGDPTMAVGWTISSPDVEIYDFDYGPNMLWGWTTCADGASYGGSDPDRYCKPQNTEFNERYSHTSTQRGVIAKHELGHSMGLRHRATTAPNILNDVMNKDQQSNGTITQHDKDHLFDQYDLP